MNMARAPVIGLIVLVTVAVGFALVDRRLQAARERPAVQRIESVKRLQQLAIFFRGYHSVHHGAWPERVGDMLREQHIGQGATLVRGAGIYQYRKPPAGAPGDWIIMWSETNHAGVAQGAPFGATGEVALKDIPPIAYVLRKDLTVDELTLEQLDQRLAVPPPVPSVVPVPVPVPVPGPGPAPAPGPAGAGAPPADAAAAPPAAAPVPAPAGAGAAAGAGASASPAGQSPAR